MDSSKWSAGVPNNGGGNSYTANLTGGADVSDPVTIDALVLGGVVRAFNSMTVLGSTTFTHQAGYSPRIAVYGEDARDSVLMLGDVPELANGFLDRLRFSAQAGTGSATLKWNGASIKRIGSEGSLSLSGANAAILDAVNSKNALAELSENQGELSIWGGASLETSGDFVNHGAISAILSVWNGGELKVDGDFSSDGVVNITTTIYRNVANSLFEVTGNIVNSGRALRIESNSEGTGSLSTSILRGGGDFSTSESLNLKATAADGISRSGIEIAGNFSSDKVIKLTAAASQGEARSYLKAGSYGTSTGDIIDGISLELNSSGAGLGIAEVLIDGPKIRNIGPAAVISLIGANSRFTQAGTTENALIVERVFGSLKLSGSAAYTSEGSVSILKHESSSSAGSLILESGARFDAKGVLENRGSVTINPITQSGNPTSLNAMGDFNNFAGVSIRGVAATAAVPTGSLLSILGRLNNEGSISIAPQTPSVDSVAAAAKLFVSGGILNLGIISARGQGAIIESQAAFANSGSLIASDGASLAVNDLSNSRNVRIEAFGSAFSTPADVTTQGVATGLFENSGTLDLSAGILSFAASGKAQTVFTISELSNSGSIRLYSSTFRNGQQASSTLRITGTFHQLQSGTLVGGSLDASATSASTSSEIFVPGSIVKIGDSASIALAGASAQIRLNSDNSDALLDLRDVDGKLTLSSRSFSPSGDFHIGTQGKLLLGNAANFQMRDGRRFESEGLLQLNGGSVLRALGDIAFGDDSELKFVFAIASGNNLNLAELSSTGGVFLGGDLSLSFSSISAYTLSPSAQFILLKGASIVGEFANVTDEGFVDVLWNGAIAGRFQVDYQSNRVVLKNFQSVPEPSTIVLLTLALVMLGVLCKTRIARAKRP